MSHPYPLPSRLSPPLARVQAYWQGLLRGGAATPFADDLQLTKLGEVNDHFFLIDVFERPERFRMAIASRGLADGVEGAFLDEARLPAPLDFLQSQCSATTESGAPTMHRGGAARAYSRLLLPLWGEGHISALLGAVDLANTDAG
jgi:hypothetical protein